MKFIKPLIFLPFLLISISCQTFIMPEDDMKYKTLKSSEPAKALLYANNMVSECEEARRISKTFNYIIGGGGLAVSLAGGLCFTISLVKGHDEELSNYGWGCFLTTLVVFLPNALIQNGNISRAKKAKEAWELEVLSLADKLKSDNPENKSLENKDNTDSIGYQYCSSCGYKFLKGIKYCPSCGKPVKQD